MVLSVFLVLFPSEVQWSADLAIVCGSLRKACPTHYLSSSRDDSIHVFLHSRPKQVFVGDLVSQAF